MSSRKVEERNEKIIRGLMKLPPNRRCINCNSLFLDMSSLQAVLPNGQMPTSFTGGVTESRFTENPIVPFIPAGSLGALELLGGPSPNTQLTSVQSQGPVAPIGGNPFA